MGKVVLHNDGGMFRFVKSFRKGGLLRRTSVELTPYVIEAYSFNEDEDVPLFVLKSVNDAVEITHEDFYDKYSRHRFWVIAHYNDGKEDYYAGNDGQSKPVYTGDMDEVAMMMAESSAKETLRMLQQTTHDKVRIESVFLSVENGLLSPLMIITCTNKSRGCTSFFSKIKDGHVITVRLSANAKKFTYEESLKQFEYLRMNHKSFLYAVLPKPRGNITFEMLDYMLKRGEISRSVVMDFKLKALKKKK